MPKKILGKRSKRVSTRQRKKVERKVREHNRKKRKEAKKSIHSQRRKDPGVPSKFPLKQQVLEEALALRQQEEAEREREKLRARKRRARVKAKEAKRAKVEAAKAGKAVDSVKDLRLIDTPKNKAIRQNLQALKDCDVVVQVLDARDPLGSRCLELERMVLQANKKLIQLLNKIDLVPRAVAEGWLKLLRLQLPTFAFKCPYEWSKPKQDKSKKKGKKSQRLAPVEPSKEEQTQADLCLGADELRQVLRTHASNTIQQRGGDEQPGGPSDEQTAPALTVAVMGFANSGKSSVVNTLRRAKLCTVSLVPRQTRLTQPIHMDASVRLLDVPALCIPQDTSDAVSVLRMAYDMGKNQTPCETAEALLDRLNPEHLMMNYSIPRYSSASQALSLISNKRGALKKGGEPDLRTTARALVRDWMNCRVKYLTAVPDTLEALDYITSEVTSEHHTAFPQPVDTPVLNALTASAVDHLTMNSFGPTAANFELSNVSDTEDEEKENSADGENEDFVDEEEEDGESDEDDVLVGQDEEPVKKRSKLASKDEDSADYDFNEHFS